MVKLVTVREQLLDTYLEIARTVLRARRRPMGARAILDAAYRAGVVPVHLRGKTQHKTLQARLSEDILLHRQNSIFYRTEPGQFSLTEFISDPEYPSKWKTPFPARRRTRVLKRADSLAVHSEVACSLMGNAIPYSEFLQRVHHPEALTSMHPDDMKERGYCAVWTFSVVRRGSSILSYRIGRYRDDRDMFAEKRSIGFTGALAAGDVSLFSTDELGAEECAVAVLQQDLDLSLAAFEEPSSQRPTVAGVTALTDINNSLDIVIVLSWDCPEWFEPSTRRLSLNEPHWLGTVERVNDLDDFEPWSAHLIHLFKGMHKRANFVAAQD